MGAKKSISGSSSTIFCFECKPRIAVDCWSWFPGERGRSGTAGTDENLFLSLSAQETVSAGTEEEEERPGMREILSILP